MEKGDENVRKDGGKTAAKIRQNLRGILERLGFLGDLTWGFGRGCWSVRKNDGNMVEEVRKIGGKTTERLIVISDKRGFPGL